jgi:hypothetical protein
VGTLTDNTPPIPPQNRDGAFLPLPDLLWPRHSPSHAPIHPRSRNRIEMAHFSLPPPLWPRHSPSHAPIHPLSRNSKGLSNFSLPPPLWVGASPSPDSSQPLARYVKVEFTPPGVHATGCWALAKAALGAITLTLTLYDTIRYVRSRSRVCLSSTGPGWEPSRITHPRSRHRIEMAHFSLFQTCSGPDTAPRTPRYTPDHATE